MIATWLVATHYRPELLRVALASIADQVYPVGWTAEVVVAHHEGDRRGAEVARELGFQAVATSHETGGGKRTAGLKAAAGDLVLVADDDDHQHPDRARKAISAFEGGAGISELREFRYLHVESGAVVRWCGRGDAGRPPVTVGTARNYKRSILLRVGGWKPKPRLIEKDIHSRIRSRLPGALGRSKDLGTDLSSGTVCLQHAENIWGDRPAVPKGKTVERGEFRLVGEGHWSEISDFPEVLAKRLDLSCHTKR